MESLQVTVRGHARVALNPRPTVLTPALPVGGPLCPSGPTACGADSDPGNLLGETAKPGSVFFLSKQEVMEKYELYRDSVDGLPSCQLEVQLYQKKIQDLAENRDRLAGVLKEVRSALTGTLHVCSWDELWSAVPLPGERQGPPRLPV